MENVIKQGYLKKAFPSDKGLTGLLDKIDPNKWFVFLIRQGKPYLEYYDKQIDVFSTEPINSFDLSSCKQVTYTFLRNARNHSFNIILEDRVLELATVSRDLMMSWCDCLEITLQRLGIYKKEDHDHVYSYCPAVVNHNLTKSESDEDVNPDQAGSGEGASAAAAPDYSTPDEYIFGTVGVVGDETDQLKHNEEQNAKSFPRKFSLTGQANEDDLSDYSGDFVPKDFFTKQHLIANGTVGTDSLNTSHVVKPESQSLAMSSVKGAGDTNNNNNVDDLDDGYCDFPAMAALLNKPNGISVSTEKSPFAQKISKSSHIGAQGQLSDDCLKEMHVDCSKEQVTGDCSKEKLVVDMLEETCHNKSTCVDSPPTCCTDAQVENMYSAFPGSEKSVSQPSLLRVEETSLKSLEPMPLSVASNNTIKPIQTSPRVEETSLKAIDPIPPTVTSVPTIKPIPRRRTHVPKSKSGLSKPFEKWETFDSEPPSPSVTSEAPSLKLPLEISPVKEALSNGRSSIPPLPPRFDSLPSWGGSTSGATVLNLIPDRPMRRVPSPDIPFRSSASSNETMPPLPPKRETTVNNPRSLSASDIAPPIPVRKCQSFRIQRPITSPPDLGNSSGVEVVDPLIRKPDRQLSIRMRVDRGISAHTVISLKHNQIDILRGEKLSAGVALELTQKSCRGVALVDIDSKVWIAGWNWKDFPKLHSKFHVGDQLLTIDSQPVQDAHTAMKILKHAAGSLEVVVRRIPHAEVLEMRRVAEGQSVGIKREGGTGEILYVDPNGLAANNGLPSKADCVFKPGFPCHWYMTEINSRPISLFFKDLEIEHRLFAVGLEVSFVVQPSDFIIEMKKQLHKKIKNYKSYLPQ